MLTRPRLLWLSLILTALAACMPKGLRLPESPLLSALEPKSGLIAYLGTDGNVYVADQTGKQPKPITTDAQAGAAGDYHIYGLPAWTPDSQRLAFAAYSGPANQNPTESSLIIAGADGAGRVTAYTSPDYLIYYNWAPDGQKLGVLSATAGQALALKLVPAGATAGEPTLLDTGSPFYWAWAPDSRSVLVHANGAAGRLAFLRLGASVIERGLSSVKATAFRAPAYSPDGRQILYAGLTPAVRNGLYLADSQGGDAQILKEFDDNLTFVWSPDGQRVAYLVGGQLSGGELAVLNPAQPEKPVTVNDSAYAFFWSPDSRSLAYFTTETLTATTSSATQTAPQTQVVWSLKIMDAASGQTQRLARFQPTDRFLQILPYFDQYQQSYTLWSPDSRNLVVAAYGTSGSPGIFVVPASGNIQPRFIAEGLVGVWSWR